MTNALGGALRRVWRIRYFALVVAGFVASRVYYIAKIGVRFEPESILKYMQFVDPKLLRTDLFRSIVYLRDQPPLFNLFLGLVLKAFPTSYARAFQILFLGMGLAGALAACALARRLGAGKPAAVVIALALAASPGAVLYENWLFYAYPLGVLWVVAALALHRLLQDPSTRNSLFAMGVLATIALARGTFHLFAYLGMLGAVLLVRRSSYRAILRGAILPTLLVVALYVKHAALFGGIVVGGFYRDVNLSMMQMRLVDSATLRAMQARGEVSRACLSRFNSYIDLVALVRNAKLEPPPPRGVAILDQPWKSTGITNYNSSTAEIIGRECARSAAALRRAKPDAYPKAVEENASRFVVPADQTSPFLPLGHHNNADRLHPLNQWVDEHIGLQSKPGGNSPTVQAGLASAALLPLLFTGRQIARFLRRRERKASERVRLRASTDWLIYVVAAGVLAYSSAVVILYSVGSQNRYRAEIMPLVWILAGAFVARMLRTGYRWSRLRVRRRLAASRTATVRPAE